MSIKKMHKKITRIRKELEYWQKSQEEKEAPKEAPEIIVDKEDQTEESTTAKQPEDKVQPDTEKA